jgi:hypothetical protein
MDWNGNRVQFLVSEEQSSLICLTLGGIQTEHPVEPVLFQWQYETLRHRGPDDHGVWCSADGCAALGKRRLAIQDFTPAGHMPMSDPSGRSHPA